MRITPGRHFVPPFLLTWIPSFSTSRLPGWGLLTDLPSSRLPAVTSTYDVCLAGLPRSSNLDEGWHNGFQALLGCTNPTIWSFLSALKLEQGLAGQKMTYHLMRRPSPQATACCQMDLTRRKARVLHDCLGQWSIRSSKLPLCCFCCYLIYFFTFVWIILYNNYSK